MAMAGDVPLLRIREATVRKGTGRSRTILDGLSLEIPLGCLWCVLAGRCHPVRVLHGCGVRLHRTGVTTYRR